MSLLDTLRAHLPEIAARAPLCDRSAAYPAQDVALLVQLGLPLAPLPHHLGGLGAGTEPDGARIVFDLLRLLGQANLSLARLFEAHVNVARLVLRFGTQAQHQDFAHHCRAGTLHGLWVTDSPSAPLTLQDGTVSGTKNPCSGAGHTARALVTVHDAGTVRMALIDTAGATATPIGTAILGMRASANGSMQFDRTPLPAANLIGAPGDYLREPDFSTGAWRTMAAILGGMDALLDTVAAQLRTRRHDAFPLQQARFGDMLIARGTAQLWTWDAAHRAEHGIGALPDQVAHVNLARIAAETAGLDLVRHAQRALGLSALLAANPAERLIRDLMTYLRQPAPTSC